MPSLHGRVRRALWGAVIVAVAAVVVGTVAVANLLAARRELVDRLDPATLGSERLLGALVDQETAVRAYVLTGRDVYLQPYAPAQVAWNDSLGALDGLVGGLAVRGELDAAWAAGERWRTLSAEPTRDAIAAGSIAPAR